MDYPTRGRRVPFQEEDARVYSSPPRTQAEAAGARRYWGDAPEPEWPRPVVVSPPARRRLSPPVAALVGFTVGATAVGIVTWLAGVIA